MEKLRYNRTFKGGLFAVLVLVLLSAFVVVMFIASKVKYDILVANMKPIEAMIVDIDLDFHVRGPNEQKIYIDYEVDGVTYSRKLKTDTKISFSAGRGADYSMGDKINIFYDPQNPEVIAVPRSVGVGYYYMSIGLLGLALALFVLFYILKNRRKYLVTQQEYINEKELKKTKKQKNKTVRKDKKSQI